MKRRLIAFLLLVGLLAFSQTTVNTPTLQRNNVWTGTNNFTGGLTLNGAGIRSVWNTYIPGAIATNSSLAAWTPDQNITLTRIDVNWANATANCTVAPTVTLTDGTNQIILTVTNSVIYQTATFSQNYSGGTKLTMGTTAGTCTTSPNTTIVTFQYKAQGAS